MQARTRLQAGEVEAIVDPTLSPSEYLLDAMWKVAEVGILCVEPMGMNRPSISDVVRELSEAVAMELARPPAGRGNSNVLYSQSGSRESEGGDRSGSRRIESAPTSGAVTHMNGTGGAVPMAGGLDGQRGGGASAGEGGRPEAQEEDMGGAAYDSRLGEASPWADGRNSLPAVSHRESIEAAAVQEGARNNRQLSVGGEEMQAVQMRAHDEGGAERDMWGSQGNTRFTERGARHALPSSDSSPMDTSRDGGDNGRSPEALEHEDVDDRHAQVPLHLSSGAGTIQSWEDSSTRLGSSSATTFGSASQHVRPPLGGVQEADCDTRVWVGGSASGPQPAVLTSASSGAPPFGDPLYQRTWLSGGAVPSASLPTTGRASRFVPFEWRKEDEGHESIGQQAVMTATDDPSVEHTSQGHKLTCSDTDSYPGLLKPPQHLVEVRAPAQRERVNH